MAVPSVSLYFCMKNGRLTEVAGKVFVSAVEICGFFLHIASAAVSDTITSSSFFYVKLVNAHKKMAKYS